MKFSNSKWVLATANEFLRQWIRISDSKYNLANIETFGRPYKRKLVKRDFFAEDHAICACVHAIPSVCVSMHVTYKRLRLLLHLHFHQCVNHNKAVNVRQETLGGFNSWQISGTLSFLFSFFFLSFFFFFFFFFFSGVLTLWDDTTYK